MPLQTGSGGAQYLPKVTQKAPGPVQPTANETRFATPPRPPGPKAPFGIILAFLGSLSELGARRSTRREDVEKP